MMAQETSASAVRSSGNGLSSRKRITVSDGAEISCTRFISAWPNGLRLAKRWMLATQSRARTFCPS